MKNGGVVVKIIIIIVAAIVGLSGFLWINGYFGVWSSVLKVDRVEINVNVDASGVAHINEREFYTFVKPYHGLAPYMNLPPGVTMKNFKMSIQGAAVQKKVGTLDSKGFDLRVYLNNGYTIPKPTGDRVIMNMSYDVMGGVQLGKNFAQFFHKFWGKGTPSWVPTLIVHYHFAPIYKIENVFSHPVDVNHKITREGKDSFTITYHDLPPNAYAEARFVFPKVKVRYFSRLNKNLNDIMRIEHAYSGKTRWIWIVGLVLLILTIVIPFGSFYFFGVEPKVNLHSEYEREIPYKDPPALVNSIVKRIVSSPDSDAFAATILSLVDKGYLSFAEGNTFKLNNRSDKPLDESEKLLLETVIKPFSVEGVFDPEQLKQSMKSDIAFSKRFLYSYDTWKSQIAVSAESKNYILTYGNVIAKTLAILALIVLPLSILAWMVLDGRAYPHLLYLFSSVVLVNWITAWIMLVLPKDVFGKWTKIGREYFLRWKNFEKYLKDYSLIKEKPPESVVLWDQYLIYGTSLGIAKEVIKSIKEVNPKIMNESNLYPAWTGMYWYSSISRLPYYAMVNSVETSSGGDVGGFGGDVGGGFGGGGRGGF